MADTLPTLPKFPTQFGEEEERRLQEVERQKTQMEEVYKKKFTPQAWADMSLAEKGLRRGIADTVFAPAVAAVTPWEFGFDYGITPEEAQQRLVEAESEYKELLRMQRVVTILPSIQNTLRALALTEGKLVTTRQDLNKYFKFDDLGFTEEEQDYVVAFAQSLLHQSPEDIIAGQIWGLNPITPEEIAQLADEEAKKIITPSQILSTVAFSESMSDIQSALQMAYPPTGGGLSEEEEGAAMADWLRNYLQSIGIDTEGVPTFPELWEQFQTKTGQYAPGVGEAMEGGKTKIGIEPVGFLTSIDESTGEPMVDPNTGEAIVYTLTADNFAWYQNELMGYYDGQRNRILPIGADGQPMGEYQQEAAIKDVAQAAHLSMMNMPYMGEQFFLNTIPYTVMKGGSFFQDVRLDLPVEYSVERGYTTEMPMLTPDEDMKQVILNATKPTTEPTIPEGYEMVDGQLMPTGHPVTIQTKVNQYLSEIGEEFEADYYRRQDAYITDLADFMKEHPEYIPRPEWTEPMTERWNKDWRTVFEPGYMAYQMANNIHTYLAAAASVGVTFATGNPLLGTATAMALFIPMETQSLIDDLIQSGATYDQAVTWGLPGGIAISSLESVGNIPLLKAVAPHFFKGFTAAVRQSVVRSIIRYGITTPLKIGATETFEEVLQEMLHNAIVKQVDERRSILENMPETVAQAFLTSAPLAFFGGGGEYLNVRKHLSQERLNELLHDVYMFEEQGIPPNMAHLMAWNGMLSTEEGIAAVEGAIEDALTEVPHTKYDSYPGEYASGGMTVDEWNGTAKNSDELRFRAGNLSNRLESLNKELSEAEEDLARLEERRLRAEGREKKKTLDDMIKVKQADIAEFQRQIAAIESTLIEVKRKKEQAETREQVDLEPEEPTIDMADEFDEKVWDNMFPRNRIELAEEAGLSHKVGSKPGAEVTKEERRAIVEFFKSRAKAVEAKPVEAPPPTTGVERWFEDLTDEQVEGKFGDEALDVMSKALDYNQLPDKVKKAVRKEFKELFGEEALKEKPTKTLEEVLEERKEAPKEGTPMPEHVQKAAMDEANALLDQTDRKPSSIHEVGIANGLAVIYTDNEGKAYFFVKLGMREGKLTVEFAVSREPHTQTSKTMFRDIVAHLSGRDIVFPPRVEMSPDGIAAYEKIMARREEPKTVEEEPSPPKRKSIRIFGVEYRNMDTGQLAKVRQELNKYKAYIVKKIKSITGVDKPEMVSTDAAGNIELEVGHTESLDAQVAHELGHLAYQEYEEEFGAYMKGKIEAHKLEELFAEASEEYVTGKPMDVSRIPEPIRPVPFRVSNPDVMDDVLAWMGDRDIFFRVEGETEARYVVRDKEMSDATLAEPNFQESATGELEEELPAMRLPRQSDFTLDLEEQWRVANVNEAIRNVIRENVRKKNKHLSKFEDQARNTWERANEEQRLEILKRVKANKSFAQHGWDSLSRDVSRKLVLDAIPDGSLHFPMIKTLADVAEFCEFIEEMTGQPFTAAYFRASDAKMLADAVAAETEKQFVQIPGFMEILQDPAQLTLIQQELNARDPMSGVEHPDNLTETQLEMVEQIQHIYRVYEPYVRYLAFMRTKPTMSALEERFPDAVREGNRGQLEEALRLRKRHDYDALWSLIQQCTWGVREGAFDPRQIDNPELRTGDVHVGYVRGDGSLNRRTRVEFPEGRLRRNVVTRMIAYINQMEIQWNIEPELNNFEKLWKNVYHKFDNKGQLQTELDAWWGRMQGIPSKYGWFTRQVMKLRRQAFAAVFIEPVLSLRNSFQPLLMHYDRSELVRYMLRKNQDLPVNFRLKSRRYFDIRVSQLAGLRQDWLMMGEAGLPGLGKLNALVDKLNVYGWSDYFPRMWSFLAYTNKAYRATQQYLKDGDVKKWIKNSGAIHMRHTEVNHVLSTFLARPYHEFNTQIDGIENMTGWEAAVWYVAQRNTDRTHFRYRREQRSTLEQGAAGDLLYSLFVFPRGYGLRVAWQAEKIKGLFKGGTSWEEARGGFNDLLKLFVVAQIFSSFWTGLTGRERNPYDPFSILTQWTFGGLAIGVVTDFTKFGSDLALAVNPVADEEMKRQARARLPREFSRIAETQIPFFKRAIDIWDAVEGKSDQDVYTLRQLRGLLDSTYTPAELEDIDRSTWEQWKKAILGAEPPDPGIYRKLQDDLQENRDMLGTIGTDGKFYTLRDYGNRVASLTKDMPDLFISEHMGSHPLDIFFKDCEAQWAEYYTVPTTPSTARRQWREAHPEEEAMMLFWGKFSESVYPIGSKEWEDVAQLLLFWFNLYKIDQTMHPAWANWGLDLTRE